MELRQYTNILIKWWWLIIASVVVAAAASFLSSATSPRTYQSRTTLVVGQALQNPNPNAAEFYTGQALAQSYTDLVRREPVLRGTLEALGLNWDWGTLQEMVSSRLVPGTQLLEIAVLDTSPQRARILTDEISRQLIKQSPAGTDPQKEAERQFISTQILDLKENIKQSQEEIRQLDDVISTANSARQIQDARTRQDSLRAQASSWQSTYAQLLTNLQQGTTNFLSVVEPAQDGTRVGTSTLMNALLAAVIGLILAGGAAFVLEYLDDTVRTSDDVRQVVNLTTLGSIARIDGDDSTDRLITLKEPRSPVAEAYRVLRTNIQFSTVDTPLRTLLITSASPQEGKSLTASNLAIVMAQTGRRVILVDADLRRPMQHQVFSLTNKLGLTSILMDTDIPLSEVLQPGGVDDLKVVTSGPIPPNPSEILGSKKMGSLIETLQQEADIIIFDGAPAMAVTDSIVLATRLDGTLLVIDAGKTRRAQARRSKEALEAVGARVLGVALNRVSLRSEGHYYQYYSAEGDVRRKTLAAKLPMRAFEQLVHAIPDAIQRRFRRNGRTSHADVATVPSKSNKE